MTSFLARIRSSPPGLQIAAAVVVAMVIGLLLLAIYLTWFHTPYRLLFSDMRPADAAAVVAELDKKKVPYELQDGGATILVPGNVVDATRLSLAGEDLPLKGVVGFEIFNKSDMGLTEFAQQINYRRALQGELERTIMELEGVDSARVHLMISEPSVFRDERRPSKASVTVIPRRGRVLPPETIRGVQRLVAAAVPDLDAPDVVVLDASGDVVSGGDGATSPQSSPADQERLAIEFYYAGRIRRALRSVDPNGRVGVSVTARAEVSAAGGDPFRNWSPGQRAFPLAVSLALRSDGPAASEIRSIAAQSVALAPDRGDSLSLSYMTPMPAKPAGAPVAAPAPIGPAGDLLASPSRLWLLLLPVLALMLVIVALNRRVTAPKRLSSRQQEAYALRLRSLLTTEEADAATL